MSIQPFAVQPGEGVKFETLTAGSVIVKADTTQTHGSMTVFELLIPPNDGPPVHTHLREDEVWYVIEGDFRFKAGDAMLRASTGGMAFGPRGVPHAFQNVGDALGRLLAITTPSGLERLFEQIDELSRPDTVTATDGRRIDDVKRAQFHASRTETVMRRIGDPAHRQSRTWGAV